jgi:L-ascorbate metabolism protein UlaG (beta-lactamase superfamily)
MNITWLGQSGFMLEHNGITIAIDPYLSTIVEDIKSYRRLMPPLISPDNLRADALFCSHNHFDHFDPITVAALMKNCPKCKIYGPRSIPERAETKDMIIPGFNSLRVGEKFSIGDIHFCSLPARHSDPDALGLLIDVDGSRIYFSGDTLYDSELSKELKVFAPGKIDLALLCINGQGGNMNAEEAASLASELNVGLAVPTHYGMFAENTVEPENFIRYCRKAEITAMTFRPGVIYRWKSLSCSEKQAYTECD